MALIFLNKFLTAASIATDRARNRYRVDGHWIWHLQLRDTVTESDTVSADHQLAVIVFGLGEEIPVDLQKIAKTVQLAFCTKDFRKHNINGSVASQYGVSTTRNDCLAAKLLQIGNRKRDWRRHYNACHADISRLSKRENTGARTSRTFACRGSFNFFSIGSVLGFFCGCNTGFLTGFDSI
jgi:hypothetical protein